MLEDAIIFNYQNFVELVDFLPYHDDLDAERRLTIISEGSDVTADDEDNNDDDDDPFIVERIIDKRFHGQRNQYEYLVRWVGCYTDQTWELPNNIPDKLIEAYENSTVAARGGNDTQYSLWPFRKLTEKNDYIKTF